MMHQSVEAGCLVSVIEGQPDDTRERLRKYMSDAELIEFHSQVSALDTLIIEEIARRDQVRRYPAADTGEVNIIRGTG